MGFSQELREKAAGIYRRILDHPMVRGIGDGTLSSERFKFYIRQDYLYLIEYSRVMALGVARAENLEAMGGLAQLLNETLNTEMGLHRSFCEEFGISREELEGTPAAPTTVSYTRHLLATAYGGSFGALTVAMVPCQWGYAEIGTMLAERGRPQGQPLYCKWIDMYASSEFQDLADWLRELVDEAAAGQGSTELARMEEAFLTSARYEYLFWDMAWKQEAWPV